MNWTHYVLSSFLSNFNLRALSYLYIVVRVCTPAWSAVPSRLHISTPGIGVDGEHGYNSSHCIGSSRVIGPSLSLLLFLPFSLSLPLPSPFSRPLGLLVSPLLTPSVTTLLSYLIFWRPGVSAYCVLHTMPKSRYLSPLRPNASLLPFCALSAVLWFKSSVYQTDSVDAFSEERSLPPHSFVPRKEWFSQSVISIIVKLFFIRCLVR